MPLSSRLLWVLLAFVPLIGADPLAAQPPREVVEKPRTPDAGGDALEHSLAKLGYTGIALERGKFGHLVVGVLIEAGDRKREFRMVVDCGSSGTLLTPDAAKALGLAVERTNGTVGGVGGTGIAVSTTKVKALKIGAYEEKDVPLLVIDIGHVNAQFVGNGEKAIDGVIGSDWMLAKKALIDVGSARLFVVPPKAK